MAVMRARDLSGNGASANTPQTDPGRSATSTQTATGAGTDLLCYGSFNVTFQGGAGVVKLEKSYDDGVTWYDVSKNADGDLAEYTLTAGEEITLSLVEAEQGVLYRPNVTTYTSGNIVTRISQ